MVGGVRRWFAGLSWRTWLVVGALLAALVVSLVARWPQEQICEKRNDGAPEQCAEHHVLIVALGQSTKFLDSHNGAVAAIAACFVAAFTFTLWRSTERLWKAGERQANLMEASVERMKDTAERELRAYVGPEPAGVTPFQKWDTEPVSGTILLRNSGTTPARGMTADYSLQPRMAGFDPRTVLPVSANPGDPISKGTVWPHTFTTLILFPPFTLLTEDSAAIRRGEKKLYCLLTIRYLDVFDNARITNHAWTIEAQGIETSWLATEHGNDDS